MVGEPSDALSLPKCRTMVCEPLAVYGPEIILDPAQRYTYADYLTWADSKRRKLIDGFVRMMSAPLIIHAELCGNIFGKMLPSGVLSLSFFQ
jgi:hypothetical protein